LSISEVRYIAKDPRKFVKDSKRGAVWAPSHLRLHDGLYDEDVDEAYHKAIMALEPLFSDSPTARQGAYERLHYSLGEFKRKNHPFKYESFTFKDILPDWMAKGCKSKNKKTPGWAFFSAGHRFWCVRS